MSALKIELRRGDETILAQDLEPGQYRIGSDLSCDIILPELDSDTLATLGVSLSGGKPLVSLISEIDGLVANNQNLPQGGTVEESASLQFSYGPYAFRVFPQKGRSGGTALGPVGASGGDTVPVKKRKRPSLMVILAGIFAVAAVASQLYASLTALPPAPPPVLAEPIITPEMRAQEFLSLLQQRLRAADLTEKVRLRLDGAAVTALGVVGEIEHLRWREVTNAIKAEDRSLLRNLVEVEPFGQDLFVGFGWSPQPYVILKSGERLRPGDTMQGGWLIESITAKSVRVKRDGATFDVGLP